MHPQPDIRIRPRRGPNTPEGKARSSANSIKHGLTSRHVVLPGENRAEFDALVACLIDEQGAKDTLEIEIIHEIAGCMWRLDRARKAESEYFYVNFIADQPTKDTERRFALILRYAGAIERELHRAITRLQQLKKAQQLAAKQEIVSSKSAPLVTRHQPLVTQRPQLTTDPRPLTTEFVSSTSAPVAASHQPLQPLTAEHPGSLFDMMRQSPAR